MAQFPKCPGTMYRMHACICCETSVSVWLIECWPFRFSNWHDNGTGRLSGYTFTWWVF